jgi:hypothetical protein
MIITDVNIAPKTVQQMLARAKERKDSLVWDDLYKDEIAREMIDFINEFNLTYDVDCCESAGCDYRVQKTVYVENLIPWNDYPWYVVILNSDFRTHFESTVDFVEYMVMNEWFTQKFLSHFPKPNEH